MNPTGPLFVQSNLELLLEVANENYTEARDDIAPFTELVKSPEHLHTYLISPLSLWNAASAGLNHDDVQERLEKHSKFPIPETVIHEIKEFMSRYGKVRLEKDEEGLYLFCEDPLLMVEFRKSSQLDLFLNEEIDDNSSRIEAKYRGLLKMELTKMGFPVEDVAGYVKGRPFPINLRDKLLSNGKDFAPRSYQKEAASIFYAAGGLKGGSGVVVLPCGAGKTVVGITSMATVGAQTLVLSPNIIAARQWIREILDKTDLKEEDVKEYSGEKKEIGPVTVATYQILTYSAGKGNDPAHLPLFNENRWGLIIYDEVHLLPAPVFRLCADVQATRRLGLTATLIREDGKETEVFSLIGPKKYDMPWKLLETQGWIATAQCTEIRVPIDNKVRMGYAVAPNREKIKMASVNPMKNLVVKELIQKHSEETDRILIIGQYIDQLEKIAKELGFPLITGKTANGKREVLYGQFRTGELKALIVSKVGNFAVDLPDANVLIQISGTYGSRQEEAQRLGRVLRPKESGALAHFYTIITRDTKEQEFSMNRQLFLTEQGYRYKIENY